MRRLPLAFLVLFAVLLVVPSWTAAAPLGYYRQPDLHGNTLFFVAEGDLWKVSADGGRATRLTSHPGDEVDPAVSPDGRTLAFVGRYEGPREVYTMPTDGGLPVRRTYGVGRRASVAGWTPDGQVLFRTDVRSTLPDRQLAVLDPSREDAAGGFTMLPLAQAADGCYGPDGTLYFTRFPFQGSQTKRYRGGTAQNLWRFKTGDAEATPLTSDFAGTSKEPLWWNGRVYFTSDRDGTMNLWSMTPDGGDLQQHTTHDGWDVQDASLNEGRVVYQLGADIHLLDLASGQDRVVPITLDSDLDQTREKWIDEPMDYLTDAHVSPDGDRVVMTARGEVFVAPKGQGRLVRVARRDDVRYRDARFMPDGKTLLALSDESGEVEFWTLPANGVGDAAQLTDDGDMLRWEGVPSPDGKYIAHHDKRQRLFLYDVEAKRNRKIDETPIEPFSGLSWSPDSKWLAYVCPAPNQFHQVKIYGIGSGRTEAVTTDRWDSYSPGWSVDGKWLYFLSDRNLESLVGSPWGAYQPEPYLDQTTQIFHLPLVTGLRSPFAPNTELATDEGGEAASDEAGGKDSKAGRQRGEKVEKTEEAETEAGVVVTIDFDGIAERLQVVPVPPGNYGNLMVTEEALFWTSRGTGARTRDLVGASITNEDLEVETVASGVSGVELSADGKQILIQKNGGIYVVKAAPSSADLGDAEVDLSAWNLSIVPRTEWRQMFSEAWRLERDYFYDRGMHGVDWNAVRTKYAPLVDRVTTRTELADILAQMVSELSALHIFVYGGDARTGADDVDPASLGAVLVRDEGAGGYRVERIYRSDPDEPGLTAPLRRPDVSVSEGDVITMINGVKTLSVPDAGLLLRNQAGRQVLMEVKARGGETRNVIVEPITLAAADNLRYHEWEYTRRLAVEEMGQGDIGYVHLRAMGGDNYTEWAKNYFPVFTRKGLIVDVRHNNGGSIDSWILNRLLRKAWMFWSQPVGQSPTWNMQYAFRGHVVLLCNERTASDGEIIAEGIRRLGIGEVIGTRTWGGEIWLSSDNFLVDGGIATAAEYGVYGPEGEWLIEGHGVDPDIVVDNLPHETFGGRDAQLEAAVARLKEMIRAEPVEDPVYPPFPDKSGN